MSHFKHVFGKHSLPPQSKTKFSYQKLKRLINKKSFQRETKTVTYKKILPWLQLHFFVLFPKHTQKQKHLKK